MNPTDYLKVFGMWNRFKSNHPKFPAFLKAASRRALMEGSVIEIKITTEDGEELESNIKVTADDLAIMEEIKAIQQ